MCGEKFRGTLEGGRGPSKEKRDLPESRGSSMVGSKECTGGADSEILSSKEIRATWGRLWGQLILQLKNVT